MSEVNETPVDTTKVEISDAERERLSKLCEEIFSEEPEDIDPDQDHDLKRSWQHAVTSRGWR